MGCHECGSWHARWCSRYPAFRVAEITDGRPDPGPPEPRPSYFERLATKAEIDTAWNEYENWMQRGLDDQHRATFPPQPLIHEPDPELEALLDEEEAIERAARIAQLPHTVGQLREIMAFLTDDCPLTTPLSVGFDFDICSRKVSLTIKEA